MLTNPSNPFDWILLAKDRLEKADALQERFGASWSGVELLHEATERYLKAFLVSKGWKLVKTHDLNLLLAEASQYDTEFAIYHDLAANLTEQFWEQHYPGGDLDQVGNDYEELRQELGKLLHLIDSNLKQHTEDHSKN